MRRALGLPLLLLLSGAPRAARGQDFSRLPSGLFCADYLLTDVGSASECFTTAAGVLGLSGVVTVELNGLGFSGCVYNSVANQLMYGTSPVVVSISTLNYVCRGRGTSTTTTYTTTTLSSTTTVLPSQGYTMILAGESCAEYLVEDVPSETECFTRAAPYVGLGAVTKLRLDQLGFTGCVYNTGNNILFYGETTGVVGTAPVFYRFVCKGIATTTTTTSTVTETSTTTITTTATTSTATTTTATTSTGTTTTLTFTTSTLTTSTATTTTETTSTSSTTTSTATRTTSTRTTTTHTGSTSTRTTTTATGTTTTWTTTQTATTGTTTTTERPSSAFIGEDPITFYKGEMRKFWLPEEKLVPLLRTPELEVLASARTVEGEQYIRRLAIRGPAGQDVIQVSLREGLEHFRPGDGEPGAFESLDVRFGDWAAPSGHRLAQLPAGDAYAHRWGSLAFAFQRLADATVGHARAEMAVVGGETATVLIMATEPSTLAADAPPAAAAKLAHLDFVLQMKQRSACEGLLPEVWGIRPISAATAKLLEGPVETATPALLPAPGNESEEVV